MFKKLMLLILVCAVVAATVQVAQAAVFITSVAHRNTDADAPEDPQIAPNPLGEDEPCYVDRVHQYNEIPEYLIGADYVITANDNKNQSAYELDITLSQNATLYVFVDNRMGGAAGGLDVAPNITGMPWLDSMGFVDTGDDIGIDEGADGDIDQYSSIFSLAVKAGTVTIFGNTQGHGGNMLGAAVLGPKLKAYNPDPADGAVHEDTWVSLSWTSGDSAVSHDVYFGEDPAAVNDGTGDTFRGNQVSNFYIVGFPGFPYPDGLVPGTTYYWRIDEVETDGTTIHKGNVWSFSIPPKKAYNPDPADGAEAVALNATLKWTGGFGAKLHTVYFGDSFDDVGNATGGLPQGAASYSPGTLGSEKVYYWRVDEFDAVATFKGDVWGFTTPGAAGNPQPSNRATGVAMTAKLSWTPATTAVSHDLYFGADKDAVQSATT
ncbi:MAG: fibronectin type III domain-containing protein, partial [Planctomycetota bacterium]